MMTSAPEVSSAPAPWRGHLKVLILIVGLGVLARLVHYLAIAGTAFPELPRVFTESDMHAFLEWAGEIRAGDLLGRDTYHPYMDWMKERAPLEDWYRWWGGKETFHQAPFYPYFLATLLSAFGDSLEAVLGIQLLIGSVFPLIVFSLGRRLFDGPTALVAAAVSALYGPMIFYQGTLLRDWLLPLVEPVCVLFLLRAHTHERTRDWIVAGGLVGLAVLIKKSILLFVPLAILWLVWTRRREPGSVAARLGWIALGSAVVLSPLMVRNVMVGAPLLASSNRTAEAFIIGNAADARPLGANLPQSLVPILKRSEGKVGRTVLETLATFDGDVGGFLSLQIRKLRGTIDALEIPNNLAYTHGCDISPLLRFLVAFSVLFPLGMAGLVISLPRWRRHLLLLLYLVSVVAGLMATIILARYRLLLVPILAIYAGYGVVELVRALRQRRRRFLALYLGCVALFAGIQWWAPLDEVHLNGLYKVFSPAYFMSSRVYMKEGRYESAVREMTRLRGHAERYGFPKILRTASVYEGNFRIEWGESLFREKKSAEAREQARRAEAAYGGEIDHPEACYHIGVLYYNVNEPARARVYLQRFLERSPRDPRAEAARRLLVQLPRG